MSLRTNGGGQARFPRASRLLLAKEYQAVFSNARFKVSCHYFLVLARPGEKGNARLGLVVSRKNVPGAAQRNRVKRLARENFRRRQTQLSGTDLVILARKNAHKSEKAAINRKLNKLLDDLSLKMHGRGAMNKQESP